MAANNFSSLFVEKYRPQTLNDIILTDDNHKVFNQFKEKGEIPNLLFAGSPGIGKTSLAKIIVKDLIKCSYLYINASDENDIETIRTKCLTYAKQKPTIGKINVIILDESDGLAQNSQKALRNMIEEYSKFTRWILTCNYIHRIIPALQSRCQSFDLTPPIIEVVKRCSAILNYEKITLTEENRDYFIKLIKKDYPDIRKCINNIQKYSVNGRLIIEKEETDKVFIDDLYERIESKQLDNIRRFIIDNDDKFNGEYHSLLKLLFNYTYERANLSEKLKQDCLIVISEYMYRNNFVLDGEINAFTCCLELVKLFDTLQS
jgi:DNA polymerase III delta prime subunit